MPSWFSSFYRALHFSIYPFFFPQRGFWGFGVLNVRSSFFMRAGFYSMRSVNLKVSRHKIFVDFSSLGHCFGTWFYGAVGCQSEVSACAKSGRHNITCESGCFREKLFRNQLFNWLFYPDRYFVPNRFEFFGQRGGFLIYIFVRKNAHFKEVRRSGCPAPRSRVAGAWSRRAITGSPNHCDCVNPTAFICRIARACWGSKNYLQESEPDGSAPLDKDCARDLLFYSLAFFRVVLCGLVFQ